MAKKVTIYDIADKLHLSPSTVSRALADSSLINIKTRTRIRKVAEEMGYRDPRNIQTEPDTIAIIVPARDNVFYNSIIQTIQGKVEDKYLLSVMCSDNSAKREKEIVSRLSQHYNYNKLQNETESFFHEKSLAHNCTTGACDCCAGFHRLVLSDI